MTLMVAHDSGYGWVKDLYFDSKEEEHSFRWPALISPPSELPRAETVVVNDSSLEDMVVQFNGNTYWLGDRAFTSRARSGTLGENKLELQTEIVKLLGSLAVVSEATGETNFKVITGIPVNQYEQYRSVVSNSWVGVFHIKFRDKDLGLNIESVLPLAQGSGVYYSLTMDKDRILDGGLFDKRVVVWDLGAGTTNVPAMQRGKFLGDLSDTLWEGTNVNTIYLNLKALIQKRHGLTYDMAGIDEIVHQGFLLYKGQRTSITQELTEAAEPVIRKIVSESESFIRLERDVDVAVLASGGACIEPAAHIFKNLMQNHVADVRVQADPFGNVKGYLYAGRFFEKMRLF